MKREFKEIAELFKAAPATEIIKAIVFPLFIFALYWVAVWLAE
jgi:hypothetical protein